MPASSQRSEVSEAERLLRLKAGDERAFEAIFYAYYKHLYAIGMQFLRSPELTQDAIQDIFLKLWHQREQLNNTGSIKALLAISMKNHVLNLLRDGHRAVWSTLPPADAEPAGATTPADDVQWQEYTAILERGLRELSPQRALVFRLKALDGLDNEQVAERLSLSVHTVKSHYAYATQFIRHYVGRHAELEKLLLVLITAHFTT